MSHKKKGQITTEVERHKHLRKYLKRMFWKGERKAEKTAFKKEQFNTEELSPDIIDKIKDDFGEDSDEVINLLKDYLSNFHEKGYERVIRCIIFLAKQSVEGIKKGIQEAKNDTRDVMYWAEYIDREGFDNCKRVRNFNKPFYENDLNISDTSNS